MKPLQCAVCDEKLRLCLGTYSLPGAGVKHALGVFIYNIGEVRTLSPRAPRDLLLRFGKMGLIFSIQ